MSVTKASIPARKRCTKRWWFGWLVIGVLGGVTANAFQPRIYRGQTTILIIPQRLPTRFVEPTVTADIGERLNVMSQIILSRTRLERIIQEFNLYEAERRAMIMEDVIEQMRLHIGISLPRLRDDNDELQSFGVSFTSPDPRTAMRVTERLASLFVEEHLEDREALAAQTDQLLKVQIDYMERRLIESDHILREAKRRGLVSSALTARHEVLVEKFKELLSHSEAAALALDLERRQIGEQFKIIDGARLPERPISPDWFPYLAFGALAGLTSGALWTWIAGAWRRRRARRQPPAPAPTIT